jgi:hypothetical protein
VHEWVKKPGPEKAAVSLLLCLLQLKKHADCELTLSNGPPVPGRRLAVPMTPERPFLTRPCVSTIDVGDQEKAYPNSCYDGTVQTNDDNLRAAGYLVLSQADVDSSSSGTLVRHPALVSHRIHSAAQFRQYADVLALHLDADAGTRQTSGEHQ